MAIPTRKVSTLDGLQASMLRAKSYTADQIAAMLESLQSIFDDINQSLETTEAHASSAHAPASAEENVIICIKRNGSAVAPENKVVDILVPTKVSDLSNDSNFVSVSAMNTAIGAAGHLKKSAVSALPAVADADPDTLYYLLRSSGGEAGDQYDVYQLINGGFNIVGGKRQDLSGYAKTTDVAKADDALITSIVNNASSTSEKYVGTANLAKFWALVRGFITANQSAINSLESRVRVLELVVFEEEVDGNPYTVTFESLTGISATGVWNQANSRIEF